MHAPWLQWEGQWSEALLTSLYNITAQQAERPAYEASAHATGHAVVARPPAAEGLSILPCTCTPSCNGIVLPVLLQRLWATLAANRLNMVPALNFLIDRGLKEDAAGAEHPGTTGKEVRSFCDCIQAHWPHAAGMQVPALCLCGFSCSLPSTTRRSKT